MDVIRHISSKTQLNFHEISRAGFNFFVFEKIKHNILNNIFLINDIHHNKIF